MKLKKYLMPTLTVFVVIAVYNFIFHGMIMEKHYLAYSHFFRPQDEIKKMQTYMYLANLIYSFAFCYIYSKGHESGKNATQGIKFGIWVSLLIFLPQTLINIAIFPYPKALVLKWLIGYSVQAIVAGWIAATVFKK